MSKTSLIIFPLILTLGGVYLYCVHVPNPPTAEELCDPHTLENEHASWVHKQTMAAIKEKADIKLAKEKAIIDAREAADLKARRDADYLERTRIYHISAVLHYLPSDLHPYSEADTIACATNQYLNSIGRYYRYYGPQTLKDLLRGALTLAVKKQDSDAVEGIGYIASHPDAFVFFRTHDEGRVLLTQTQHTELTRIIDAVLTREANFRAKVVQAAEAIQNSN
jgi:hypothetical protein